MFRKLVMSAAALAILVTGAANLRTAGAAAPGPNGETLFRQRCQSCHSVTPGRTTPLGPSLIGVVGRKAGATPFRYSPALKASGLTWSRASLDRFLASPPRAVPGTRMVIAVSDPAQRAALIAYLETKK